MIEIAGQPRWPKTIGLVWRNEYSRCDVDNSNEPRLVERTIEEVMVKDQFLSLSTNVLKWISKEGWSTYAPSLISMMTRTTKETLARNVIVFRQIATMRNQNSEPETLCNQLATIVVGAIEKIDSSEHDSWNAPKLERKDLIIDMARSLVTMEHAKGNRPIRNRINVILQALQSRTKEKPSEPTNWKRESKLGCGCADCLRLSAFLADPTQPEARFPMAKQRRQHLHDVINRHQCDCTHDTLRIGSPQVLVCKKTTASYERACKVYAQDVKHLTAIQKITAVLA